MAWKSEITRHVETLPPEAQQRVFQYVCELNGKQPTGVPRLALLECAGILDAESAREMIEAIEAECERVDTGGRVA